MSKHSKWSKIKRLKGVTDAKRGNVFTKLSRAVTVAARKGTDPAMNFELRIAVDKARAANMPKDTIERAIERASGGEASGGFLEVVYEAFGPEGVALVIEATTDNKNRTVSEIKKILADHGGRLANPNSVLWLFTKKGMLSCSNGNISEEEELRLIDHGAEDIAHEEGEMEIITSPERLARVKKEFEAQGRQLHDAGFVWIPKERVEISAESQEKLHELLEALDTHDDIQTLSTNALI